MPQGFTLVEILAAILISSLLTAAIYSFFITQHHAYTVQEQVVEMEQSTRAAMDMIRRELRMAGHHAVGTRLINHLPDFVPPAFIPAYPVPVNLDANPKISRGSGDGPDVITFLSVIATNHNPTALSAAAAVGSPHLSLALTGTQTGAQYNIGDLVHIGVCSEYAKVTAISGNTLTIDTNPAVSGNQGLARTYPAGTPVGEISVVSYAVFNEHNDPSFLRHDPGHPVLKRKVNAGGFQPLAENITGMQVQHTGSGEILVTLSSRTDRPDHKFADNNGYRTFSTRARIRVRNADHVAVGTACDLPSLPSGLMLSGLDKEDPCKIHVSWDRVTGPAGCGVSMYYIYYGTVSGVYPFRADVGDVTGHTLDVSGRNACTYYVRVAAVNSAGTGPKSAEGVITDLQAPAAPAGVTAENIDGVERRVVLSWEKNTECDLQGYHVYGKSESVSGVAPRITAAMIPKTQTHYADTGFSKTQIDCAAYSYHIEAKDSCPNPGVWSAAVYVSPAPPAPPTTPGFATDGVQDTLSWKVSENDFDVNGMNYIAVYRVYGPSHTLLAADLAPGTEVWHSPATHAYYDVSATDACGNESETLRISSACTDTPEIRIDYPRSNETVSGTVTIHGTARATGDRTITGVKLKLDDSQWIDLPGTTAWSWEWMTTKTVDGDHFISIGVFDSAGCYSQKTVAVTVSNPGRGVPELFCRLYGCRDDQNHVFLAAQVFDLQNYPVSGAAVTFDMAVDPDVREIFEDSSGYYGGDMTPPFECELLTDTDEPPDRSGIATRSRIPHTDSRITIAAAVEKDGRFASCFRTLETP